MELVDAYPTKVRVELDASDLHNVIGALHTYHSNKLNLLGSPFEIRLRDLITEFLVAEEAMHDQSARERGLVVEGDEPCVGGAF